MASSSTSFCSPLPETEPKAHKSPFPVRAYEDRSLPTTTSTSTSTSSCYPPSPAYLSRPPSELSGRNPQYNNSAPVPSGTSMSRVNSRGGVLSPATSRRRSFRGCCPSPCSCSSPLSPMESLPSSSPSSSSPSSSLSPLGTAHALLCPPPCLATLVSWLLSSYLSFIASLFDNPQNRDNPSSSQGNRTPSGSFVSTAHSAAVSPGRSPSLPCNRLFSSPSLRSWRSRNNAPTGAGAGGLLVTASSSARVSPTPANTEATAPSDSAGASSAIPLLGPTSESVESKPGFPGSEGAGSSRISFSSAGTSYSYSAGHCSANSSPSVSSASSAQKEPGSRGRGHGVEAVARRSLQGVFGPEGGEEEEEVEVDEEEEGGGHEMTFRMEWGRAGASSHAPGSMRPSARHTSPLRPQDEGEVCMPLMSAQQCPEVSLPDRVGQQQQEQGCSGAVGSTRRSYWEDEDCCPTCLEEYSEANPRIDTECGHHFHLVCIYEWMERSPLCPVCMRTMSFKESCL